MRWKFFSINVFFGNFNVVMFGDVFYFKVFFEFFKMGEFIVKVFFNVVLRFFRGEIEDVFVGECFNSDK